MKKFIVFVLAAAVSLSSSNFPAVAQEKPDVEKETAWMKKKLELSQNILAGLTSGDFRKINQNAQSLNFIGYLEKWERKDDPDYKQQLSYFVFANKELMRQTKEKNLDGATLAYNQLTLSCVQCHKIVRSAK